MVTVRHRSRDRRFPAWLETHPQGKRCINVGMVRHAQGMTDSRNTLAEEQKGHERPERRTERKPEHNAPDRATDRGDVGTHRTVITLMDRIRKNDAIKRHDLNLQWVA